MRNRTPWIVGAVLVVVVLVAAVVALGSGDDDPAPGNASAGRVLSAVSSIPDSVFAEVGVGSAGNPPSSISDRGFTRDGKPHIAYVGAEFCPYCAAERWAMVVALSRFGTFTRLPLSHSSKEDVFPNTQTFSFRGSAYESDVIAFTGTETRSNELEGGDYAPLDTPEPDVRAALEQHSSGSIPFVDFGGKYVLSGATFDPGVLQGKSGAQIAAALDDPRSPIAQGIVGSANVLTAAICETIDQPKPGVCTSPPITDIAARLAAGEL